MYCFDIVVPARVPEFKSSCILILRSLAKKDYRGLQNDF